MRMRLSPLDAMALILVVLTVAGAGLAVYWQWFDYERLFVEVEDPVPFRPTDTAQVARPQAVMEWRVGETIALWRRFCYYRRPYRGGTIRREFHNGGPILRLADVPALVQLPLGCASRTFPVEIPEMAPGHYKVGTFVDNEQVNPIKTVSYTLRPVSIVVLPSGDSPPVRLRLRIIELEHEIRGLKHQTQMATRSLLAVDERLRLIEKPWWKR